MFGKVYIIVPTQIPPHECLGDSCLTLSLFARNSTNYTASNTTLLVSEGHHILDVKLAVSDVAKFVMQSKNDTKHALTPIILCTEHANFNFNSISAVHLHGLKFSNCSMNTFNFMRQLIIRYSKFTDSKSPLKVINSSAIITMQNLFSFKLGQHEK